VTTDMVCNSAPSNWLELFLLQVAKHIAAMKVRYDPGEAYVKCLWVDNPTLARPYKVTFSGLQVFVDIFHGIQRWTRVGICNTLRSFSLRSLLSYSTVL
jgi:hypothetical protein